MPRRVVRFGRSIASFPDTRSIRQAGTSDKVFSACCMQFAQMHDMAAQVAENGSSIGRPHALGWRGGAGGSMDVVARGRGRPRKALIVPPPRCTGSDCTSRGAARLKDMIVRGVLPAGATLVETDLSVALGVSGPRCGKPSSSWPPRGWSTCTRIGSARVPDWTPEEILELFEALAGIERLTAELAAPRISEALMDDLRGKQAQLDRMHRDQVLDAYFALNQEIHRTIVTAAHNVRWRRPTRRPGPGSVGAPARALQRQPLGGIRPGAPDLFEALAGRDAAEGRAIAPSPTCCGPGGDRRDAPRPARGPRRPVRKR